MTETTQPDPQVVAWMRGYRQQNPLHRASAAVEAYLNHLSTQSLGDALRARHTLAPLVSAWSTAGKPLTPDADGTGPLIEAILRKLDREDVTLRGEVWRASIDGPYALTLTQWADSGERGEPTGPKVRVTFTVHVEDAP